MNPWQILGIEATSDDKVIKRAYAKLLKQTRPEQDKEGFIILRQAYEDALERSQWLQEEDNDWDDEDDNRDFETVINTPVSINTNVINYTYTLESTPITELLSTPVTQPNLEPPKKPTMADYQKSWQIASQQSEEMLIQKINEDIHSAELIHIELRLDYSRQLLIWFLRQPTLWPNAFAAANQILYWSEQEKELGAWPWSQLADYQKRCLLHDFFINPKQLDKKFPILSDCLLKLRETKNKQLYLTLNLHQKRLERELKSFKTEYADLLANEPEGNRQLQELERRLQRLPLGKVFTVLGGVSFGVLLIKLAEMEQGEELLTFLIGVGFLAFSFFILLSLARDLINFLLPKISQFRQFIFSTPSTEAIVSLFVISIVIGIPSSLLWLKLPNPDSAVKNWLEFSASLLAVALTMVWTRFSHWLVYPSELKTRWLDITLPKGIALFVLCIFMPIYLLNADLELIKEFQALSNIVAILMVLFGSFMLLLSGITKRFSTVSFFFLTYMTISALYLIATLFIVIKIQNDNISPMLYVYLGMMIPILMKISYSPESEAPYTEIVLFLLLLFNITMCVMHSYAWYENGHLIGITGILIVTYIFTHAFWGHSIDRK